ncbi:hypothetical protein [Canibacter oris]|uniref:Uncharacterized protein n=1 Tax=Canibacter oris TaxID=1365628 RepID=A0A840DJF0_9MICO|nr:hypothetical protein [Canibacter oris]MBB4071612.1 hypothetical protein [Canibacter oris]
MKHRRDSKKYIWFEPWVVVAWVRYKALVDNGLEQRRRAAGFELTDEEKQRIIKTWIRAGGKLPEEQ